MDVPTSAVSRSRKLPIVPMVIRQFDPQCRGSRPVQIGRDPKKNRCIEMTTRYGDAVPDPNGWASGVPCRSVRVWGARLDEL
jgi:hypothetical protein